MIWRCVTRRSVKGSFASWRLVELSIYPVPVTPFKGTRSWARLRLPRDPTVATFLRGLGWHAWLGRLVSGAPSERYSVQYLHCFSRCLDTGLKYDLKVSSSSSSSSSILSSDQTRRAAEQSNLSGHLSVDENRGAISRVRYRDQRVGVWWVRTLTTTNCMGWRGAGGTAPCCIRTWRCHARPASPAWASACCTCTLPVADRFSRRIPVHGQRRPSAACLSRECPSIYSLIAGVRVARRDSGGPWIAGTERRQAAWRFFLRLRLARPAAGGRAMRPPTAAGCCSQALAVSLSSGSPVGMRWRPDRGGQSTSSVRRRRVHSLGVSYLAAPRNTWLRSSHPIPSHDSHPIHRSDAACLLPAATPARLPPSSHRAPAKSRVASPRSCARADPLFPRHNKVMMEWLDGCWCGALEGHGGQPYSTNAHTRKLEAWLARTFCPSVAGKWANFLPLGTFISPLIYRHYVA